MTSVLKREKWHKMTWAMLVPRRGAEFPRIAKASMFIAQLGHDRVTLRCDNEPAIEAFGKGTCTSSSRRKPDCARETSGRGPVQRNHRTHGGTRGQARTLKAAVEHRSGVKVPPDARPLCWLLEFAAYLMNRWRHRQRRKDADRQAAWTRREQSPNTRVRRGQTAREESQRRGEPHVVRDAQTSVPDATRSKKNLEENDAVGAPSCSYHAGRIPRERNEGRERQEQCIELGVNLISRSSRHDALRLQREVPT